MSLNYQAMSFFMIGYMLMYIEMGLIYSKVHRSSNSRMSKIQVTLKATNKYSSTLNRLFRGTSKQPIQNTTRMSPRLGH